MIQIQKLKVYHEAGAYLPEYATDGSAGADLCAYLIDASECSRSEVLAPGERKLIPTGLYFEVPPGFEIQIRPRSGLALKHGVTVVNTPGTIDSDYRGEVKVLLINHSHQLFNVKNGERIAQMVLAPVVTAKFESVYSREDLNDTERGAGGYGSTGV